MSDARAVLIAPHDDVAVALEDVAPQARVAIGSGRVVIAREAIPSGHKLAVRNIGAGEVVCKYGSPIGQATRAIDVGMHVHVHNLQSDRLRGDR
jgi:SAF domain